MSTKYSDYTKKISTTDADRLIVLQAKKVNSGLTDAEKEEIKQIEIKIRKVV